MAYNALNNLIDAYIYANGVQAITGQILNGVLKQMVSQLGSGYHLMGVAVPATEPASNDYAMAYFAATAGEYTDFGGITLAAGEVAVLLTSGNGSWSKQTIYNVPTTTEDLENTAGFITNAVTDLVNYYTKDDTDATLANYPTISNLATALADYYTKTEIDGQMGDVDTALADRYTKGETDTKLGDYYKKTETYDKGEVDSLIATLSRQEYIVAWDGASTPDDTAIPAGVTVTYSGTTYTGTLVASASTMNKIQMVWNGTAYDMYGTSADGGYSWVYMGTTTVDLSQYATKEELNHIDLKIDGKAITTYTLGYIKTSDGSVASATNRQYTDYIDVSGMLSLTFTNPASTSSSPTWGMAWYDESKTYISGYAARANASAAGYVTVTRNVPSGAKYARFTRYSDPSIGDFWIKLKGSYEERLAQLEEDTDTLEKEVGGLIAEGSNTVSTTESTSYINQSLGYTIPSGTKVWVEVNGVGGSGDPVSKVRLRSNSISSTPIYIEKSKEVSLLEDTTAILVSSLATDASFAGEVTVKVYFSGLNTEIKRLDGRIDGVVERLDTQLKLSDFDTDYIVGRFATDAEQKTFTGDFHFTVQPDYHINENIIISCRARYENTVDDSVPDILFRFTNGQQSQYISSRYILGEKGQYIGKEWRIPAFLKNCYLYVDVRIPENVTVYIDEISNRYSGEISRETAGFRMNAHTAVFADFNTLEAFTLSAKVGYPCCICVPKRTSDGVWVCFHDDSNIGEKLVDENHDALVEPEYSAAISDITFARLNQLTYKEKNGEYLKVPTLEQFFFVCAKTGMRPMFSWHPVPTVEQMAEVKAMADKFDLLPYLNIKIAFGGADNVAAMNNVHSVFGDEIESYWGDVNVNTDIATIISALDSTNLDKTKTRVGLEIFDNRVTIEKVQSVRAAGYLAAIAFMNSNPSSATMESWIKNGVCEFTENRNFSNGLTW